MLSESFLCVRDRINSEIMALSRVASLAAGTAGFGQFTRKLSTSSKLNQLKVENLLIIGSGLMGSGVAQSSAMTGKFNSIVVQDVSQKQLDVARGRLAESLLRVKKKNRTYQIKKSRACLLNHCLCLLCSAIGRPGSAQSDHLVDEDGACQ